MNREKLYKFFEGKASVEEGMEIKLWVESSDENRQSFYDERILFNALLIQDDNEVCKDCSLADEGVVHTSTKHKSASWRIRRAEWLRIAGVLVLSLIISYFYQEYKDYSRSQSMSIISVPAGQRVNVTLPDGSNVWLNARTTIQYTGSFNQDERVVMLKGEAYFNVAKDKKRPFIVRTEKYNVEVLGTQFNVSAYPGRNDFETALMGGSVKINTQADPNKTIVLVPNQKACLKNGKLEVMSLENNNPYRWKEGFICFKDESFADIMKCFEKYYGIKIIINNKQALKYDYTGTFKLADGLDYALNVLEKDINIKCERENDDSIIYIN